MTSHSGLRWLAAYVVLAVLLALTTREALLLPDGKLHAYFFDIGQGDAVLLISPSSKQILIDGGPNLDTLEHLGKYMSFFDRTLELLILTHPDADHITALPEVLRRYDIERILITGDDHTSSRYAAFMEEVLQEGAQLIEPDPHVDIDMGDGLVLDIIWPTPDADMDSNDLSIVVRALFGTSALLLSGDIEAKAEAAILATGADIRADVLKVPHHGSRTSSSTGFLLAVDPTSAIISAGRENQFGHPHQEVLDRYVFFDIRTRNTQEEGTIHISF